MKKPQDEEKRQSNEEMRELEYAYSEDNKSKKEGESMDLNEFVKMYIEKLDRDQSEFRADMRTSEARMEAHSREVEARMEAHSREMEKRMEERSRRNEAYSREIEDRMDARVDRIEQKMDRMEDTLDSMRRDNKATSHWIMGVCIATILSVVSMAITIIVSV